MEPLLAVYDRASTLRAAEKSILEERMSMRDMIERLTKPIFVPRIDLLKADPMLLSFWNINTWSELKEARRTLDTQRVALTSKPDRHLE